MYYSSYISLIPWPGAYVPPLAYFGIFLHNALTVRGYLVRSNILTFA